MMRSVSVIALSLCASAAFADCPTSYADAAQGVYVEFEDHMHRFDRRPDGSVEEIEVHIESGDFYRFISHHGMFILESWAMEGVRIDPSTYEVITYDPPLPSSITANSSYSGQSTTQYVDEGPFLDQVSLQAGSAQQRRIGECVVTTIDVQLTTDDGVDAHVDNYVYFPDLGFGAYAGGGPVSEAPQPYVLQYIGTDPRPLAPAPAAPPAGGSK